MSARIKFKYVTLRNFLSFGNREQTFYLDAGGTTSISGENLDIGGSNGSGKTSVINAICYALYNKPFDNITLQRLINSTNQIRSTQMEVRLAFSKDNTEYEIVRSRGTEYNIQILKDGTDITPGKGAIECDQIVLEIIELSYDVFVKSVIFSGNSPAFLQLPLFQQRAHIEELFNISTLSEKASILKERIRETEQNINIQEAICKQQEISFGLRQKQISDARARSEKWGKQRTHDLELMKSELEVISHVHFDQELLVLRALQDSKRELQGLKVSIQSSQESRSSVAKKIKTLRSELEHLVQAKCPYCLQSFADYEQNIVRVQNELEQNIQLQDARDSELESLRASSTKVQAELQSLEAESTFETEKEFNEAKNAAGLYQNKIQALETSVNPYEELLSTLENSEAITVQTDRVNDLRKRLQHEQFLLKLLVDKTSFLRKHIITRSIPFLNERLNYFTRILGLPHIVKFDADMSCTVSEYGRELDFGNLSAGEKKRVNTAMALAFRNVLHRTKVSTNLLMIDELDGQLDVPGIDSIVRALKDISRDEDTTVFVISHHPSILGRLDTNLVIRKEHGFSAVISE